MSLSEAQRRAQARYAKQNTTRVGVTFYPADAELLAYLNTQPAKATYIKQLIREDMQRKQMLTK